MGKPRSGWSWISVNKPYGKYFMGKLITPIITLLSVKHGPAFWTCIDLRRCMEQWVINIVSELQTFNMEFAALHSQASQIRKKSTVHKINKNSLGYLKVHRDHTGFQRNLVLGKNLLVTLFSWSINSLLKNQGWHVLVFATILKL